MPVPVTRETPAHVLLYGPPGAGKLTVARRLAEHAGFRVVDNHAAIDPALRLFDYRSPMLRELAGRIRLELLAAAAEARIDVVSTLVYSHPEDLEHAREIADLSRTNGVALTRVQLLPSVLALEERVQSPSRVGTEKITDVARLRRMLATHDLRTPIDESDLRVDNSALSPDAVVERILEHLAARGA